MYDDVPAGLVAEIDQIARRLEEVSEHSSHAVAYCLDSQARKLARLKDVVVDAKTGRLLGDLLGVCGLDRRAARGCQLADTSCYLRAIGRRLGGSAAVPVNQAADAYNQVLCYYDQIRGAFGWGGWSAPRPANPLFPHEEGIWLPAQSNRAAIGRACSLITQARQVHDRLDEFVRETAAQVDFYVSETWLLPASRCFDELSELIDLEPKPDPSDIDRAADWLWGVWFTVIHPKPALVAAAEAVDMLRYDRNRALRTCHHLLDMCARPS